MQRIKFLITPLFGMHLFVSLFAKTFVAMNFLTEQKPIGKTTKF